MGSRLYCIPSRAVDFRLKPANVSYGLGELANLRSPRDRARGGGYLYPELDEEKRRQLLWRSLWLFRVQKEKETQRQACILMLRHVRVVKDVGDDSGGFYAG